MGNKMRYIKCCRKTTFVGFDEDGNEILVPRFDKNGLRLVKPVFTLISKDAVEGESGFVCDCGRWTKEDSDHHRIVSKKEGTLDGF